jgi:protein SCO1/2
MKMCCSGAALAVLVAGLCRADSGPKPVLPKALQNVGFDQRLNEQVPLELTFRDEEGRSVRLGDFFREGKPVILTLVYYRCPMLCTQVLNGLVQGMRETPFTVGEEFEVVTVSIDPSEMPQQAVEKKANYLRFYGKPASARGWHFLCGDQEAIRRLAQSVGFRYSYEPQTDQFAHPAGIVVLTPSGLVSRYFYDVKFSGRDLRLGLVEASQNKIGSPIDQVLLFCFHYDPTAGKYGAAIMNIVRAGGVATLLALGLLFWRLFRSERNRAAAETELAAVSLSTNEA